MHAIELQRRFDAFKTEATKLAGGLTDLCQRATVYHHIFRQSGGNHGFPLIAAHGALWAQGYFRFGFSLGRVFLSQYAFDPARRVSQFAALQAFADVFRDINRCVCVDTYANYHFTQEYGEHPAAANFVPSELLEALNRLHAARRRHRELTESERRSIFEAHFRHEQRHVVGPRIEAAVAAFDWPLLKFIALRPPVRFAYFPTGHLLWFRNFADRQERIEKGLRAFEVAEQVGWKTVESAINQYAILPAEFFASPGRYFASMRQAILATAG